MSKKSYDISNYAYLDFRVRVNGCAARIAWTDDSWDEEMFMDAMRELKEILESNPLLEMRYIAEYGAWWEKYENKS